MTRTTNQPSREERLSEILLAYLEACEAGQSPEREQLLFMHPDLCDDLREFFAARDEIEGLMAPIRILEKRGSAGGIHDLTMTDDSDQALGTLGDYRLVREIGRGGMGIVYEAEQLSLRRRVALKVLPFASALDPRQLQRFKNEASAAAHLQHENIVPVHAVGCERGVHYYAMQFIEGQSLAAYMSDLRQSGEPRVAGSIASTAPVARFSTEKSRNDPAFFDWVAGLGRQAALALEHAHLTGVVHRDIKPGNLLLDPRGQLWVTDFGLAQIAGDNALTITGEMLGTLRYASPEQGLGKRGVVDHRSDLYSLGATLYELLTLRPPFDGADRNELLRQIAFDSPPPMRTMVPSIPQALETIVLKALRKDPSDRYATAREMADDLQRFLERKPIQARRPGPAERFVMWSRRHPAILLGSAVVLVLVTVGSLISAALIGAERQRTREEQLRASDAYQRERDRAEEAESRLVLARRAVDELFSVSEEDLAGRPGNEFLRKRILRSALAFYQEFLTQRQDNTKERDELIETTRRVERILDDLAVLRSATQFYLLCQPVVLDDLGITPVQMPRIRELTTRVGREWADSVREMGLVPATERVRKSIAQARIHEASLNEILTDPQEIRLQQIRLQSEGPGAFRDPEVAAKLGLTADQREQIRIIEDDSIFGWMREFGRGPGADAAGKWKSKERSTAQKLLEILTEFQAKTWQQMIGKSVAGPLIPFGVMPIPPQVPQLKSKGASANQP